MPFGSDFIHGIDAEVFRSKVSRSHFSDQEELEQKTYEKRSKACFITP